MLRFLISKIQQNKKQALFIENKEITNNNNPDNKPDNKIENVSTYQTIGNVINYNEKTINKVEIRLFSNKEQKTGYDPKIMSLEEKIVEDPLGRNVRFHDKPNIEANLDLKFPILPLRSQNTDYVSEFGTSTKYFKVKNINGTLQFSLIKEDKEFYYGYRNNKIWKIPKDLVN